MPRAPGLSAGRSSMQARAHNRSRWAAREREGATMEASIPQEMRAAALDRYGGPEVLHEEKLPVPKPKPGEVLIRLDGAGVGVWDPAVRSGEFEIGGRRFPKVIGND